MSYTKTPPQYSIADLLIASGELHDDYVKTLQTNPEIDSEPQPQPQPQVVEYRPAEVKRLLDLIDERNATIRALERKCQSSEIALLIFAPLAILMTALWLGGV